VSIHLPAFRRDIDVAAAGIAGNDPEFGAEQIVGDLRIENTATIRRLNPSCRHQLSRMAPPYAAIAPGQKLSPIAQLAAEATMLAGDRASHRADQADGIS
jgi:hypothetical protein